MSNFSNFVDERSAISVIKRGNPEKSDKTSTENKLLYKGLKNPIRYERYYNLILECEVYLQKAILPLALMSEAFFLAGLFVVSPICDILRIA